MKRTSLLLLTAPLLGVATLVSASTPAPLPPAPNSKQLAWQRSELSMFLHFGVNTFTDREWGEGDEEERLFNPTGLDARQWARAAKEAGFKRMIITAKHHDGFCLWPSRYTEHCVKNSPWKGGKGDVLREFADACRQEGIKAGIYLSPWDRHEKSYGSDAYNDHFVNQLAELFTNYGPIDQIWFDGACGEGPNGKRQVYDWPRYYRTIQNLSPNTLIGIGGDDIRWVGNESGLARLGEASVQIGGNATDGKRHPIWFPAECDVSIRPGWFYHAREDATVKPLEKLLEIYYASVGRNSLLLLNVPPDRRGRFADADIRRLKEFGAAVRNIQAGRLDSHASADSTSDPNFAASRAVDGNLETYWAAAANARTGVLELDLGSPQAFNVFNVQEPITLGERVAKYHIEVEQDGRWHSVARGTVIGNRNLLATQRLLARRVRLVIDDAKASPCIAEFSVHRTEFVPPLAELPATANKPAVASDVYGNETNYGAHKAVDNDENTRWATNDPTRECWLEVDLEKPCPIDRLAIREMAPRIGHFALEYRATKDEPWRTACRGEKPGDMFHAAFPPVTARWVRLHILDATFAPTIWEFQVFQAAGAKP